MSRILHFPSDLDDGDTNYSLLSIHYLLNRGPVRGALAWIKESHLLGLEVNAEVPSHLERVIFDPLEGLDQIATLGQLAGLVRDGVNLEHLQRDSIFKFASRNYPSYDKQTIVRLDILMKPNLLQSRKV